jgi:transcriptional regulator with GAF, ATPase, and Fis domain
MLGHVEVEKIPGGLELVLSPRTVVLASADAGVRNRLRNTLTALRWKVFEANGGAAAVAQIEASRAEALLIDSWLPDLEINEFSSQVLLMYPSLELIGIDGSVANHSVPFARRNELLHAVREAQNNVTDTAAWLSAPAVVPKTPIELRSLQAQERGESQVVNDTLPELIGVSEQIRELTKMIRLVAPRSTTVLIEGETGTGKELVAKALHRLSDRSSKPFVVLNCAAIPESLLEAELFGHTRGAFTGAVQSRTGRIEAAHGGTLFLDEIGEMPLALQAKMLRFLECGELQRVGDNATVKVDVRVIAATHQPLEQRSQDGSFRLDLYHRLAVFPIDVPPLRDRIKDIDILVEFFLEHMGQDMPRKRVSLNAMEKLKRHHWPGNVRELIHVLERSAILSSNRLEIEAEDIRWRHSKS